MDMAPTLFRILLALVALYAFLRGSRDERYAGAIMIVGAAATHLAISPLRQRFGVVETPVMMVDIAVFAGFLWIALRSQRFWPMWIAGLQLTAILGHVMKLVDTSLFSRAYGAALVFWAWPIVLLLAIGTWRAQRRTRREGDDAPI